MSSHRYLPTVEVLENRQMLSSTPGITDPARVVDPVALPLQPVGVPFVDPAFGTTLRRVSDTSEHGGFETQIYSQLQAFSSDDAYLLLAGSEGYVVRRTSDFSLLTGLDTSEWNAPRWHPTLAHTIVHYDTNADQDVTVQFTDVDTGVTTDVFTLPAQYLTVYNNQSFDEISEDGRWMAGMVRRQDGESVLFSVDIQDRRLGAVLSLHDLYTWHARPDPVWGEVEPDWVGVSPLGRYLVVGWQRDGTEGASGVETFDIQTGAFVGRVNDGHQHGDLGVMPDGTTESYMTFEIYGSPADHNRPAIGLRLLPGNAVVSEPIYLQSLDWGNGEHISARGPNGVGLITSGVDPSNGWTAFEGELWLQYTDNRVLRLAHHRSTSSDYWVQPRASMSRDGRYVVFASDWGRQTDGRGDPYIIDLQAGEPSGNRPPVLNAIADQTVTVGRTVTFTASASDPDGDALTYSLDPGAPAGAVINPTTGVFSWTPGSNQPAGNYRVTVRVTDNGSPAMSAVQSFTITVLALPRLRISDATVQEGDQGSRSVRFTVLLSSASSTAVTVNYATADGSAVAARDYTSTRGTLTFAPGQTSKTIAVPVLGDRLDEDDETFLVTLGAATGAVIERSQGQGTIVDDDSPPALSIGDVSIAEGNAGTRPATFTVRLSAASGRTVTVQYSTADGTAAAGNDYVAGSGTLTFQPGEISKSIAVQIRGDVRNEPNETFFVNLANAVNAGVQRGRARGTIVDDDPAPALSIQGRIVSTSAGQVVAEVTVVLSAPSDRVVTVSYVTANGTARAGRDYTAARGTLTFNPGETVKTILIEILRINPGGSEATFSVALSRAENAGIAVSRAEVTIRREADTDCV